MHNDEYYKSSYQMKTEEEQKTEDNFRVDVKGHEIKEEEASIQEENTNPKDEQTTNLNVFSYKLKSFIL